MITKTMRQSSRMHNGRKTRTSIKITPNRWEKVAKKTWWQKIVDKVKSLAGQAKAV